MNSGPTLHPGSTGPDVRRLQRILVMVGAGAPTDPGPVDGNFGTHTTDAVRAYQGEHGLGVDGIVGDRTWWVPAGGAGATLASLAGVVMV
jgi:peptidoglycan hydrolase-like protein with peptidoglycan-binding domain